MVIVTSRALPTSAMYDDTPAPLNAEPTLMPSMLTRPSLVRPPAPPKTTMPGTTWVSIAAPACVTVFGISCIRLLYERVAGIDEMMSLSSTVWRRMLWTSTIGDSPVTVIVSSIEPTLSSASTVAVNVPGSSMP